MTKSIPKWVQERFSLLWKKHGEEEINFETIKTVLKMDDKNTISVFISELKKADWVEVNLNKEDSRKRVYKLKNPIKIIEEMN